MSSLSEKVVLVTGGTSGIGLATVKLLRMPVHVTPNLLVMQHINHQVWP
ncbi:MAG: hypothetical protein RMM08_09155 [Armatimonadota bacterium]|nr:hypothetical protein [bacterium]MDW8321519.1 hypothetical protein [Armatimonadota bacterium]